MKKVAELIRDPIWQGLAAIVGILVVIFSFFHFGGKCFEPIYEKVIDAELCGTTSEEYIVTPARPQTCRLSEFGRERWANVEESTQQSGWRSGGSNQPTWCEAVKASFSSSRRITGPHEIVTLHSSESGRWTGIRHRQYNYTCTIRASWNPVYNERTDERCGMIPAEVDFREVPNQCDKKVGEKEVKCGV